MKKNSLSKIKVPDPGKQLVILLSFASIIACGLVYVRSEISHNYTYYFMIWNLFLAWIPFIISSYLAWSNTKSRKWYFNLLLGACWLLFFPNAPYVLTDLVHLKPRVDIPYWYDFLILIFFCFNCIFLAFASLIQIKRVLDYALPKWLSHVLILTILQLTSFGIYLGRFERYNSWDLIVRPGALFHDIYQLLFHSDSGHPVYYIVFFLALFLNLNYFTLLILNNSIHHPEKEEKISKNEDV